MVLTPRIRKCQNFPVAEDGGHLRGLIVPANFPQEKSHSPVKGLGKVNHAVGPYFL